MMIALKLTKARESSGKLGGLFLAFYALFRIIGEMFREPDSQYGYFLGFTTMGQILCLPMLAAGLYLIFRKKRDAFAA